MRITQGMINTTFRRDLNFNLRQLAKYEHQLASGKRISRPSDDPVGIVHSLRLRSDIDNIDTYRTNVDHALSWLGGTEDVLTHVADRILRATDLALVAANGSNPQAALDAIAEEVDQLIEDLVQLANSSQAGQYLFGGTKTKSVTGEAYKPFELERDGAGKLLSIKYNGNNGSRAVEIGEQINFDYNMTGVDAFAVSTDVNGDYKISPVFDSLIELVNNVRGGNTEDISQVTIGKLEQAHDHLIAQRTEVGAKMNRLEMAESRLGSANLNFTALLSKTEDLNVAETIVYLKAQEAVYRAALATGARIMQPTLVDFLR